MRSALLFALLNLGVISRAWGNPVVLYDNTFPSNDTFDTVLYSTGPYVALGDQIHLAASGFADQAQVELFNNGGGGTFDIELDLFAVGSPVGAQLGSFDFPTPVSSTGGDVIDLSFNLLGLAVPQDLVFTVSISNQVPTDPGAPLDLGVDMFEPPVVGSSDNTFMIAATSGPVYSQIPSFGSLGQPENVYFELSGTTAPESSSLMLFGTGLLALGLGVRKKSPGAGV